MASTRNKNTRSDYNLQQKSYKDALNYNEYIHSQQGRAFINAIPELGYMPSHMPREAYSYNSIDIESMLHGTGETNLVEPKPNTVPKFKLMPTVSFFKRNSVIMPKKLHIDPNQRPFPI